MKHSFKLLAPFLFLACHGCLRSQERDHFFYRPFPYGTEALFNPISLLANGGFDSFQILNDRHPTWNEVHWNTAGTNVWRSITAPLPIINRFGWNRFLRQEVFPTSLNINDAQYVPNYVLHMIGGGMAYRKISEWYDYQGVPVPYIFGAATRFAYEYINETVENGPNYYPNEDCLPDILIFQPLGIALFSFDGISEFFSSTLNLNDWSEQVVVTFAPFAIRNAGQNFVMKYSLNQARSTSLFFHFGDFAILGLSFKTNHEDAISFGGGLASTGKKNLPVQNGVPSNTVVAGTMAGIYYDRNNSLLASIVYSESENNRLRLNVFPGVLPSSVFSPGLFVTLAGNGTFVAGLTAHILPIGLGIYSPR
ncbi:MAG TPA: hypothetical protein VI758_03240 [Bacteroidota bacterium]